VEVYVEPDRAVAPLHQRDGADLGLAHRAQAELTLGGISVEHRMLYRMQGDTRGGVRFHDYRTLVADAEASPLVCALERRHAAEP